MISKTLLKEDERVDILFTGLIRTPERFKQSIEEMKEMQKEGIIKNIILSTWVGEVEKFPDIGEFLIENGVKIIKSEEPNPRGWGNIWCQMKALDVALNQVEEGRFALKTRSDVHIKKDFLRTLFLNKKKVLKIEKDLPRGNIFKYKVWCPYFELKTIFHMADECFFGERGDMKKLVNYDGSYDTLYKVGGGINHIRRFIHPFLEKYPELYHYLKRHSKDSPLKSFLIKFSKKFFEVREFKFVRERGKNYKINIFKKQIKDEKFLMALIVYYSIINSHFYIDSRSADNLIEWRNSSRIGPKSDVKIIENNFTADKMYQPLSGQIYIYDMELLDALFNNKFEKTRLNEILTSTIKKFYNQ